ncbi:MAG: hypothetical protein AB8G16_04405 [Gammaproteobacteria bacterium]
MSALSQDRWDEIRFELLQELAVTVREMEQDAELDATVVALVHACALAYDRPPPGFTIYQRLRSFKAGQWLLVRNILAAMAKAPSGDVEPAQRQRWERAIVHATQWLQEANDQRDAQEADALEVQLQVLHQLLVDSAQPDR